MLLIDAAFPGGNSVLEKIEGETVCLHQDLRDTEGDWFYWCFRVRGGAGRTLTFQFTQSNCIGVRGPAVSLDGGRTWSWLGQEAVREKSFRHALPEGLDEVRYSVGMPYVESHLQEFLARHAGNPNLQTGTLCRTPKGRETELLRVGRLDGRCKHRVAITCRQHACEMMPNYALEGLIESILGGDATGAWFRECVEFLLVPFMDKDGVEEGDQGKNRKPHDHNRDYAGESIYPSVRALREQLPAWSQERLKVALDLHCPWIRGRHHEELYLVGTPKAENWARVGRFSEVLASVQRGPLVFHPEDNLPFGQEWNTYTGPLKTFQRWAEELPGFRYS